MQNFINPVIYTVTAEDGSTSTYTVKIVVAGTPKSAEKQITAFTFAAPSPVVSTIIDQTTRKITATVAANTDLTKLIPTLTLSAKAMVSPASGMVQNFTNPVSYTVTAEDGSRQSYEVTLKKGGAADVNTNIVYVSGYAFDADTGNLIWFNKVGSSNSENYSPTIRDGVIYTGGNSSSFYALDLYTGIQKWEFKPSGSGPTNATGGFSSPIIIGNTVYIGGHITSSGAYTGTTVYALDITTGNKKWEFSTTIPIYYKPDLVGESNTIYACISDKIFALDAASGAKKWEIKIPPFEYLDPKNVVTGAVSSNPYIHNNTLYFSNSISYLYKVDLTKAQPALGNETRVDLGIDNGTLTTVNNILYYTGSKGLRLLRIPDLGGIGDLIKEGSKNPSIFDETLYSSSGSNYLFALDAMSGVKRWEFRAGDYSSLTNPVAANGMVYIGERNSNSIARFYAVDAKTGQKKWEQTLDSSVPASPVIRTKDGTVYHSIVSGMQQ